MFSPGAIPKLPGFQSLLGVNQIRPTGTEHQTPSAAQPSAGLLVYKALVASLSLRETVVPVHNTSLQLWGILRKLYES
jgi:hypothetical protein